MNRHFFFFSTADVPVEHTGTNFVNDFFSFLLLLVRTDSRSTWKMSTNWNYTDYITVALFHIYQGSSYKNRFGSKVLFNEINFLMLAENEREIESENENESELFIPLGRYKFPVEMTSRSIRYQLSQETK